MKQLDDDQYELLHRTVETLRIAFNILSCPENEAILNKALKKAVLRVSCLDLSQLEERFRAATYQQTLKHSITTGQIRKDSQNRDHNLN